MPGQNTLLVNNIQTLLAYSADIQSEIELSAELTAGSCQFYMEEKVQLKNWMIDEESWRDESPLSALASDVLIEPEPEIVAEEWMIQPFSAGTQETWEFLVETIEEPIKVRKWMVCCADWNLKKEQASLLNSPVIMSE
jgi:hypothetical protein